MKWWVYLTCVSCWGCASSAAPVRSANSEPRAIPSSTPEAARRAPPESGFCKAPEEPAGAVAFKARLERGPRDTLQISGERAPRFPAEQDDEDETTLEIPRRDDGTCGPPRTTAFELEVGATVRFGDLADYIQELSNREYTRPRLLLGERTFEFITADRWNAGLLPSPVPSSPSPIIGVLRLALAPEGVLNATVVRLSLNRPGDRVTGSETLDAAILDDKRCDGALAERLASMCDDPLRPCERVLVVAGKEQMAAPLLEVLGLLQAVAPSRMRAVELYQRRGQFEPKVGGFNMFHEQSFKASPPVRLLPIGSDLPHWVRSLDPEEPLSLGPRAPGSPPPSLEEHLPVLTPYPGEKFNVDAKALREARALIDEFRGLEADGKVRAETRRFRRCPAAIAQTLERELAFDRQGRVRMLRTQGESGVARIEVTSFFDAKGRLRVRRELSMTPKTGTPRAARDFVVLYRAGQGAWSKNDLAIASDGVGHVDRVWGQALNLSADGPPVVRNSEEAKEDFERPSECELLSGLWQGRIRPPLSIFDAPIHDPNARLPWTISSVLAYYAQARDGVRSKQLRERTRGNCPVNGGMSWDFVSIVEDEGGTPRAFGTRYFGPHGWVFVRAFYDELGLPRLIASVHWDDHGNDVQSFVVLDTNGCVFDSYDASFSEAEHHPRPSADLFLDEVLDPKRAFAKPWNCVD
jgi:hypothetical protein